MKTKVCFLISGMHRSGTSALAGVLDELGIEGGDLMLSENFDNPYGFYENASVVEFNQNLLKKNNTDWADVNSKQIIFSQADLQLAEDLVKYEYNDYSSIYIKDPRISLLLDFWIEVLEKLDYEMYHIFCGRHPRDIIHSLAKRNNFSFYKSSALIQRYWISALKGLNDIHFLPVSYEQLLSNPESIVESIEKYFSYKFDKKNIRVDSIITDKISDQSIDSQIDKIDFVQNIYNVVFNHSIGSDIVYDRIKSAIENPPTIDVTTLYSLEDKEPNFCKVLFDDGSGFKENNSLIFHHDGSSLFINKRITQRAQSIRIIPIHKKCIISIRSIIFRNKESVIDFKFKDNSYSKELDSYVFKDEKPTFILEFDQLENIDNIEFDFSFSSLKDRNSNVDSVVVVDSKFRLLWQSFMLFLKTPFSFLGHFNIQNFRTLRSALRRENPQTIYRNLKKLLLNEGVSYNQNATSNFDNSKHTYGMSTTVLYVCGQVPEFDKSSGAQRADKTLSILSKFSNVIVLYNKASDNRYTEYYRDKGIQLLSINELKNKKDDLNYNLSSIIFNKYYTYYDFKEIIDWFPYAKVTIDAEDIAWLRESRSIEYTDLTQSDLKRNKSNEIDAYKFADNIWCVTQNDKKELTNKVRGLSIDIVSNIHDLEKIKFQTKDSKRILFFANFKHEPNVSALKVIIEEIFPHIKNKMSTAILCVAGSNMDIVEEIIPLDSQIEKLSFIPNESISSLYNSVVLVLAPLLFGSGIKGKITEAITYKVPVITNAIGNEGINLINEIEGFITEDYFKMASYAIGIINDRYNIESITEAAIKKLQPIVGVNENSTTILNSLFPKVSICIVTYNRLDLLKNCIDSIIDNTSFPNYEVLIYSNGCTDGSQDYIRSLDNSSLNIRYILSDKNDVYVIPNNRLIDLAGDNDIVLLNNDVIVKRNWLSHLWHTGRFYNKAGIIGGKVIYPEGRLQEYGSEIYDDGSGHNIGKKDDPSDPIYNTVQSVPYVSGCCMYIKRSTIVRIGKLDEIYSPCYYEDSDFCYRAWLDGLASIVTPLCVIVHHEGASAGVDIDNGFKKYQVINRDKFLSKHKAHIVSINRKSRKKLTIKW